VGDVAVGARSGQDDPEDRSAQGLSEPDDAAAPPAQGRHRDGGAKDRGARFGEALSGGPREDGLRKGGPPVGGTPIEGASDSVSPAVAPEDKTATPDEEKKHRSFWKELPILIGIALILALIIKTFLVQAFSIPSDSMQNTLQRGDRVLVDKLTPWFGSKPERGEVVVFHDPGDWLQGSGEANKPAGGVAGGVQKALSFIGLMPSAEEQDLIKRVIAVGGDTVECEGSGPVKVNGKALSESSYIFPGNTPCSDKPFGPVTVPKGMIWVMGDHRQDSLDSRYHERSPDKGFVDEDLVVGRAFSRAWPPNRWGWLSVPGTFSQPGINAAGGAAPAALGLVGAVPIVLLRRRRLTRKAERASEAPFTVVRGSGQE
jgi:signal peptidase I